MAYFRQNLSAGTPRVTKYSTKGVAQEQKGAYNEEDQHLHPVSPEEPQDGWCQRDRQVVSRERRGFRDHLEGRLGAEEALDRRGSREREAERHVPRTVRGLLASARRRTQARAADGSFGVLLRASVQR